MNASYIPMCHTFFGFIRFSDEQEVNDTMMPTLVENINGLLQNIQVSVTTLKEEIRASRLCLRKMKRPKSQRG